MSTKVLTYDQRRFCDYVEQTYHLSALLPTNEAAAEAISVRSETILRYWGDDRVRSELSLRGVDLAPERSQGVLSSKQLQLANLLLNLTDRRSFLKKLEAAGVSENQYQTWLRNKTFADYLTRRAEQLYSGSKHEAYTSVVELIRGGDLSAIKLFFEMQGIYNPKVQVDVNLGLFITQVIEVVARHVNDKETMERIAVDLELIEGAPKFLETGG